MVLLRSARTSTRPEFVGINLGSRQAVGLVHWWAVTRQDYFDPSAASSSAVRDQVGGRPTSAINFGSTTNAIAAPSGVGGFAIQAASAADYLSVVPRQAAFGTAATVSVWVQLRVATPVNDQLTGFCHLQSAADLTVYPYTDGTIYCATLRSNRLSFAPLAAVDRAQPHLVTITSDGTYWRFYQNGQLTYENLADASIPTFSDSKIHGSSDQYALNGRTWDWRMYNRALTPTEVMELYAPATRWELYDVPALPRLFARSTATGYSLTADPGTYTLTGVNADLLAGRRLTSDVGTYTTTGVDASLRRGSVLVTEVGAYLLTGTDAELSKTIQLLTDVGAYNLAGVNATLVPGFVITPDVGAYTLDGFGATLFKEGGAQMTADPGVYALTGVDASLLVHRVLSGTVGSYTVTGVNVAFEITRLRTVLMRRLRRSGPISDNDRWLFHRSLQIDLEAGMGTPTGQGVNPQVMLRWSDDGGETWSNEHIVSAGKMGEYQKRAIWYQLGRSRDRVYETTVSDPVAWNILAAILQIEKGIH